MIETIAWTLGLMFLYGIIAIITVIILIVVGVKWKKLRASDGFIKFAVTSGALCILISMAVTSALGLFIYINSLI
jgi:hypothetical protein